MINYKDPEELEEAYKSLSPNDIAQKCGVSNPTIRYWLKKFGIKTRSVTESMLKKSDYISSYTTKYWSDPKHRKQQSNKIKKILKTNYTKQQRSEWAKKNWLKNQSTLLKGIKKGNTAEKKNKIAKSVKKSWTPKRKKQQAKITKSLWQDQRYITKTTQAIQTATNTKEFRRKVSENSKKMWSNQQYREKHAKPRSLIDTKSVLDIITTKILIDMGIDAKPINLGPWTFDIGFKHGNRNILIECQGQYWHSIPEVQTRDKQKKTYYDKYLSNKYELYYIYEHEFYGVNKIAQKINTIIGNKLMQHKFKFSDLDIKLTDNRNIQAFFNKYHYLAKGKGGIYIGAFLCHDIVAALTYSGITRKQTATRLKVHHNNILELNRLCIHPSYQKKNFGSWFISKSIKFIPDNIKVLIAFSETAAGHTGTIYRAAGWKEDGFTKSSYWYIDKSGIRYHKKSIWDQAKRIGMTENEYADSNELYKIKGGRVIRFTKWLSHS